MTEAERLAKALILLRGRENRYLSPQVVREIAEAAALIRSQAAEIEALKQTLHDELDANLRLRELGGARSDEPMTTFLERVFAERYALRALCIDYSIACGELSKGLSEDDPMWSQLKSLGERIDAAIDAARQS